MRQIAAHRLPLGAGPGDRLGLQPRIVLRHDRRRAWFAASIGAIAAAAAAEPVSLLSFS